jgi:ring-1,2-phenylacetyl-CoA epoxidase subunit PaaE
MSAPEFHTLTVSEIESLTDDAVAITFAVPDDVSERFRYLPGQHVTVRAFIDGEDVRRSYSVCADANSGVLRVGVKHIAGGVFSTYATTELRVGDHLEVMPPVGEFTIETDPANRKHYAAIAAGSGITPVLSMISTVLDSEPESRFTLVFGNRDSRSVMFLEELEGLKDRFPSRFHLVHVLSREPSLISLFSGRIDGAKLEGILDTIVDATDVDAWYLCGPYEMVQDARKVLTAREVPSGRIHDELFFSGELVEPPPPIDETVAGTIAVTFTLDGRSSLVRVDPDGPPILDYALQARPDTPWSCRGGMCTTCKAQVLVGDAVLDRNFALTDEDVERGYILTCQAHPTTAELEITYDV